LTVQNNIDILAETSDQYGAGIALSGPGTITNAGTIVGGAGIEIFGTVSGSYIDNRKVLNATLSAGIYLQGEGALVNTGSLKAHTVGLLLGNGGTALNGGTISATTGIEVLNGTGNVAYNGGRINAQNGILLQGGAGEYALNIGKITASNNGIELLSAGSVANYGSIRARETGVFLANGGTNYSYGKIVAENGIYILAGGSVINSGAISASGSGIIALGGTNIDNMQGGTIDGAADGIILAHGGTIFNSGLIDGGSLAVSFATAGGGRLILAPTGSLIGSIELGSGTLELASGSVSGAISAANLHALHAGGIQIDAHSVWKIAGDFTAAAGTSMLNSGTLIEGSGGQMSIDGSLSGNGLIEIGGRSLTLASNVGAGQIINFMGTGEVLDLGDPAGFRGEIENFTVGDTIMIATVGISGTTFSGGVLTLDEGKSTLQLTFASLGQWGSDVFALTSGIKDTAITLAKPKKMAILTPAPAIATPTSLLPDLHLAGLGVSLPSIGEAFAHHATLQAELRASFVPVHETPASVTMILLHGRGAP
jgi:hypothetical protein